MPLHVGDHSRASLIQLCQLVAQAVCKRLRNVQYKGYRYVGNTDR